jgi:hypothetical protein
MSGSTAQVSAGCEQLFGDAGSARQCCLPCSNIQGHALVLRNNQDSSQISTHQARTEHPLPCTTPCTTLLWTHPPTHRMNSHHSACSSLAVTCLILSTQWVSHKWAGGINLQAPGEHVQSPVAPAATSLWTDTCIIHVQARLLFTASMNSVHSNHDLDLDSPYLRLVICCSSEGGGGTCAPNSPLLSIGLSGCCCWCCSCCINAS